MDIKEILEEAQLAVEMITEELSGVHIPTDEMELCKKGILPEHWYATKQYLMSAGNRITTMLIKIDKWKDVLDDVPQGDVFYRRHMEDMSTALRELQKEIYECANFIRDKTRKPLVMPEKKWYLKREGEE